MRAVGLIRGQRIQSHGTYFRSKLRNVKHGQPNTGATASCRTCGRHQDEILGVQMRNWYQPRRASASACGLGLGAILAAAVLQTPAVGQEPIKIGHVAALSGGSAQSGEAITRGLTLAIDEINAKGGLLGGRKLELIQRDDESIPPKGVVAARELIAKEKVVALFGGIDTPVALAIVPVVNKEKVPYMGGMGRRYRHHAQWRQSQFRVSRLGGRCAGRRQAARLREQEVRREEAGAAC